MIRIALAQFNPIVGDISGNLQKIVYWACQAREQGADMMVTPELALTGYNPEDLLLRDEFLVQCDNALQSLLTLEGITVVLGHPAYSAGQRFNAATVLKEGQVLGQYHKMRLPNNTVFDECRYFVAGSEPLVFELHGVQMGVLICEDVWTQEPVAQALARGAQCIVVLNASPFHREKITLRHRLVAQRCLECGVPMAYVNMIGGQDELIFDGASFALNRSGQVVAQAPAYEEALLHITFDQQDVVPTTLSSLPGTNESVYRALVLGVRDYVGKNGFPGVLLGLSGGIDSALTLVLACDALGSENVQAVMMPSPYTADISLQDAQTMAQTLKVPCSQIDIWPIYQAFMTALAPSFVGSSPDSAEENVQARIRGMLLMALSNKSGRLVLSTGNKSEMATGYCTLYGDMAGGFAVLKDVGKTLVYQLAQWRNASAGQDLIPQRVMTRAPSAELRPDQTDQDSLPPYDVLDTIIQLYIGENRSIADIITQTEFTASTVKQVVNRLHFNEYKRRQAPVGPRISERAFGKDWRYPIGHRFNG